MLGAHLHNEHSEGCLMASASTVSVEALQRVVRACQPFGALPPPGSGLLRLLLAAWLLGTLPQLNEAGIDPSVAAVQGACGLALLGVRTPRARPQA